jgi:hypothetical protein
VNDDVADAMAKFAAVRLEALVNRLEDPVLQRQFRYDELYERRGLSLMGLPDIGRLSEFDDDIALGFVALKRLSAQLKRLLAINQE